MSDDDNPPAPSLGENRREHPRHGVLISVRLQDESRLRQLYATDLSNGGMFLATRSEMEPGQRLVVSLVHPITEAAFEIECEVANVRREDDGTVRGCGLRFVTFDDSVREGLELFVEGVVELEPEEDLEILEEVGAPKPPPTPPEAPDKKARARGLLAQGRQLAREGNLVGAAHVLSRATALDPSDESLWDALREVEGALSRPAKGAGTVDDGSFEVDLGELDAPEAATGQEVVLEELATIEPADRRKAKLLYEAGLDCHGTGDHEDAIGYLERAVGADPTFVPAYCALAKLVDEARGDRDRCVFLCTKALEIEPANEKVQALLASVR